MCGHCCGFVIIANPVKIRFFAKTSEIRNIFENITSDLMLSIRSGNTGTINDPELQVQSRDRCSRTAPLFRHEG